MENHYLTGGPELFLAQCLYIKLLDVKILSDFS